MELPENRVRVYSVTVERVGELSGTAASRGHTLGPVNLKKGGGEAGFNAVETLLTALGTCLLTNINAIAPKMRLRLDGARVELKASRTDNPPAITAIEYTLVLDSPEPEARLRELHELAFAWGTVSNTLLKSVPINGALLVERGQPVGG